MNQESSQILDTALQPGFFTTSAHQLNELAQYGHNQYQELRQLPQQSNILGQHFHRSTTAHTRKRPRSQKEEDLSILEEDNDMGQMPALNDAVKKISLEDEAKAMNWIRDWLEGWSAKALPSSRDIDSLASLTRLPPSEVHRLLVQMLLRPMKMPETSTEAALSCGDSAQPTSPPQQLPMQQSNPLIPAFERAILWAKSRGQQCKPTKQLALLVRDPNKKYQCTLGCGEAFKKKADWMRHETTRNYPQEGWLCNIQSTSTVNGASACSYCHMINPSMDHAMSVHGKRVFCHNKQMKSQIYFRKDKFLKHCESIHPSLDASEQVGQAHFWIRSDFPSDCGFCNDPTNFSTSYDRFEHISAHFEAGKDMTTWNEALSQSSDDSDGDDDNDDEDDDDNQNNDGNFGGGKVDRQNAQNDQPFLNHHSGNSGSEPKDSRQSSSNSSGASKGNRHGTQMVVTETNLTNLLIDQVCQEECIQSHPTVNEITGQQNASPKEHSIQQNLENPKNVANSITVSSKSVLRNYFKPCKDICTEGTAESDGNITLPKQPNHTQMRGLLQKLMEVVISRLTIPGGKKLSTKIKVRENFE